MRKTRLMSFRMQAVLGIGSQIALFGGAGYMYGHPVVGAIAGTVWGGLVNYISLTRNKETGSLAKLRKYSASTEELEEAASEWYTPETTWGKVVTWSKNEAPDWAQVIRGRWVAEGMALIYKEAKDEKALDKINWTWMDWLNDAELNDAFQWWASRLDTGEIVGLAGRKMNPQVWTRLSKETMRDLLMSRQKEVRLAATMGVAKAKGKGVDPSSKMGQMRV